MIYFLLTLMVAAWSANFLVTKVTLREIPPFALLFLRVFVSSAILLVLYLLRRERKGLRPGDWRWFAALGFFGIAMNQLGVTLGIHHTTLGHSSLIVSLTPIFVLVLATRMGLEMLTPFKVFGMMLSLAGVVVLTLEHGIGSASPTFLGDIIIVGGSVAFALYTVYSKQMIERYDVLTFTAFTYWGGAIFVALLGAWELPEVNWPGVTLRGWAGVLYMSAIASVAAYLGFYYALTKISASRVIVFSYLQPLLVILLGIGVLGEKITTHLLVGGTLVLVGVVLAERGRG